MVQFNIPRPFESLRTYEIVVRIARGGMSDIYFAHEMRNGLRQREVILKRLSPMLRTDPEHVAMFMDEARLIQKLDHDGIPKLFDFGYTHGAPYMALEYVRGVPLDQLQARCDGGRVPIALGARIGLEILSILRFVHTQPLGIVHRDVSPDNVLITWDGTVKLIDFGIAKADCSLHQTTAGLSKGKLSYMAPEQLEGRVVDERADLFSLAEVLYKAWLGAHPFGDLSPLNLAQAVLADEPTPPSELDPNFPPALENFLMRALEKNPDKRYESATEMFRALEGCAVDRTATTEDLSFHAQSNFPAHCAMDDEALFDDFWRQVPQEVSVSSIDIRDSMSMWDGPTRDEWEDDTIRVPPTSFA